MSLFDWSDDYSVGVPSLDAEHLRLVGMLNELHDSMASGGAADHLTAILDGLAKYTVHHFRHEEELMSQYGLDQDGRHAAEHRHLVDQVVELQGKLARREAKVTMELLRFMKNWLIGHILGVDKAYGPILVENRVL